MKSLKLSDEWDIGLDALGNIAFIEDEADIAQTVANATRVFQGEYVLDTTKGVPYTQEIFGKSPTSIDIPSYMQNEAEKINGVSYAEVSNIEYEDRVYKGDINLTLE